MHPIEITTPKATVLVVQVPEIANRFKVFNDKDPYLSFFLKTGTDREYLPPGQCQILSLLKDITEEQARSIVERFYDFDGIPGFYNYPDKKTVWSKATESLHSLLTSHGVDTKQNHIILIKEK